MVTTEFFRQRVTASVEHVSTNRHLIVKAVLSKIVGLSRMGIFSHWKVTKMRSCEALGAGCWPTYVSPAKNSGQPALRCSHAIILVSRCVRAWSSSAKMLIRLLGLRLPRMHMPFCRFCLGHIRKGSPNELSFSIIDIVYENAAACAVN